MTPHEQEKYCITKQKILKAVDILMSQYNFDSVTVRKICEIADVSIGSFYHHFNTKENLLTTYLTDDHIAFTKLYFEKRKNKVKNNLIEKIIEIFKCCANHCYERGYEFTSAFQSTKNRGLLPSPKENYQNKSVFTPLFHQSIEILSQGQADGLIDKFSDVTDIAYDLCLMCHGFIYNWCVSEGELDLEEMIDRIFRAYLNGVVTKPISKVDE